MNHKKTLEGPLLWQAGGLIIAVLAAKAVFILKSMPSMWIWGDEMLYYMTAYDLLHLGKEGVPHPNFLNYPPLTSLLVMPVHLIGASGAFGYQLSLIILSLVQVIGAIAACLTVYEIFGTKSRLLLLLLLVGPTAYTSFSLMSEAPFVALYLWLLYFYVRQLKTDKARYAIAVGLMIALMILTRKNAVGLYACLLVALAAETWWGGWDRLRQTWWLYTLSAIIPICLGAAWKLVLTHVLKVDYGYYGASGYLEQGFYPALESLGAFLLFTRKFLSNLSYVSLSTYGLAVPLLLWFCFSRRPGAGLSRERDLVRQLLVHVLIFFLFSGFAAATQMFIHAGRGNTRYLMYGRYMEYFAPILIALVFALLAKGWRWEGRSRSGLIALAAAISAAISAIIPLKFFLNHSGASSNLGVTWLLDLAGDSPVAAVLIGPALAVALAVFVTSPRFQHENTFKGLGYAAVIALAVFNLSASGSLVSGKSQAFNEKYSAYSQYVSDNPDLFENGLFVDVQTYTKRSNRHDRLATHKLLVDHVDKVSVGKPTKHHLKSVPVLSQHKFRKNEVVFQAEGFANKIYPPR